MKRRGLRDQGGITERDVILRHPELDLSEAGPLVRFLAGDPRVRSALLQQSRSVGKGGRPPVRK